MRRGTVNSAMPHSGVAAQMAFSVHTLVFDEISWVWVGGLRPQTILPSLTHRNGNGADGAQFGYWPPIQARESIPSPHTPLITYAKLQ